MPRPSTFARSAGQKLEIGFVVLAFAQIMNAYGQAGDLAKGMTGG